jgi:CHAT domain-containing protein/tetratricopeptide (TPR) repeat protein
VAPVLLLLALFAGEPVEEEARAQLAQVEQEHGPDSKEAAEAIGALLDALRRAKKPPSAETRELAQRALTIEERRLGATSPALAPALRRLGLLQMEAGDYKAARPTLERAHDILETAQDPSSQKLLLDVDGSLATLCRVQGDYKRSRELLEHVLAIQEQTLGPAHADVARTLNGLGNVLIATGDYAAARERLYQALAIWTNTEGRAGPRAATTLHNLGKLTRATGALNESKAFLEEALAAREAALGAESLEVADTANLLANVLADLGEVAQARAAFERALAIYEEKHGPNHPDVARASNDLGTLLWNTGDSARAKELYERALAIRERVFPRDHPDVAQTLNNLGLVLLGSREWDQADALLARSEEARTRASGPDDPSVAKIVRNRALLERRRGNPTRAEALYRRSLSIYAGANLTDHPEVGDLRFELAGLLWETNRNAEAQTMIRSAIELQERTFGPDHPRTLRSVKRAADVLWDTSNNDAEARALATRAARGMTQHLRDTVAALPEREALRFVTVSTRPEQVLLSGLLASSKNDAPAWRAACWDWTLGQRGLVLDQLAMRTSAATKATSPDVVEAWERLAKARRRLASLWIRGPEGADPKRHRHALDAAVKEKEAAELALAQKSAVFESESALSRAGLHEVASALPARTALVEIVRAWVRERGSREGRWHDVALILRPDATHDHVDLGRADRIARLVTDWRAALERSFRAALEQEGDDALAVVNTAGQALRRTAWDPVLAKLGTAERVLLVPDGSFHQLDPGALPAEGKGFLLERGPVVHLLGAGRDVLRLAKASGKTGRGALVLGAPDFDASPAGAGPGAFAQTCLELPATGWPPLRGAWHEAASAAEILQASEPTKLLRAAEATETSFRREAKGKRILHLATHAYFLERACDPTEKPRPSRAPLDPSTDDGLPGIALDNALLLSGLVLAGANHAAARQPTADDGILTAEEIAALDLTGVDLAILSGCDTGLGRVAIGEGVYGLERAFQIAGARAVVMSLWQVPDQQAPEWVRAFYAERARGSALPDATRGAALELLNGLRQENRAPHPYLWSGRVTIGDWR